MDTVKEIDFEVGIFLDLKDTIFFYFYSFILNQSLLINWLF